MAPQVLEFLLAELEHEILGKPVNVASDRPSQDFGFHAVGKKKGTGGKKKGTGAYTARSGDAG